MASVRIQLARILFLWVVLGLLVPRAPVMPEASVVRPLVLVAVLILMLDRHFLDRLRPAIGPLAVLAAMFVHALLLQLVVPHDLFADGLKAMFLPALAGIAALQLADRWSARVLAAAAVSAIWVNLAVGLYQRAVGVDGLLAQGVIYGEEIREANDHLRAFGLLPYGIPAGHTVAILCIVALAVALAATSRTITLICLASFAAGVVFVYLTITRTALIALAAAVVYLLVGWRPLRRLGQLTVGAGLVVLGSVLFAAATGVAAVGTSMGVALDAVSDLYSLGARLVIWSELSAVVTFFGNGAGFSGVAAAETSGAVVVDNYYLTTLLNVGFLGVLLLVAFFITVWVAAAGNGGPDTAGGSRSMVTLTVRAVVVALMVENLTLNAWEDVPTGLVGVIVLFVLLGLQRSGLPEDVRGADRPVLSRGLREPLVERE